jgi:amidohydrolase
MEELVQKIDEYLNSIHDELLEISRYIFQNPEVGFKEKKSSLKLVEVLKKNNFEVTYPVGGLETAFKATFSSGINKPHIAVLAEYDALPKIGHACGHNLIATAALGAGLAVSQLLTSIQGKVSVIGSPAEEILTDSGKMKLLDAGVFKGVDVAMMVHPHGKTWLERPFLAVDEIKVCFHGKSSHAASTPHLGINAYDALQLTFAGLSFLRQQLRQDVRVHWGDLKVSGAKNVIPDSASATINVRALDDQYLKEVGKKVVNCIKGAALMTSSEPEYEILQGYRAMKYNRCLNDVFVKNIGRLGINIDDLPEYGGGSTDMGNVSQVVPSIHPFFKIKDGVVPHTKEFAEAADTEEAFKATMFAAKALAMTGIDLLTSPETFNQVREQFEK